jgi:hypothetical protein
MARTMVLVCKKRGLESLCGAGEEGQGEEEEEEQDGSEEEAEEGLRRGNYMAASSRHGCAVEEGMKQE